MKRVAWILIFTFWGGEVLAGTTTTNVSTTTSMITSLHTVVTTQTLANGLTVTATQYTTDVGTNVATSTHISISTDTAQQLESEKNTQDLNNQGASSSTMLGMAAIAAGAAMVAKGTSMLSQPPTASAGAALIAAGMQLIMQGMQALAAASKMNKNAGIASGYGSDLSGLGTTSVQNSQLSGNGDGNGIQIDPALLHTGKVDGIMADMENQTGMSRDDLANALSNGQSPLAALANSPALKGTVNGSEAKLNDLMAAAKAGDMPSAQDTMDKLGLNANDLNMVGGLRSPAAASASSDYPFAAKEVVTPTATAAPNGMKISSEIQAALDKNGITGLSLFEMVHTQYRKKTSALFGERSKRDATAANPYSGGY